MWQLARSGRPEQSEMGSLYEIYIDFEDERGSCDLTVSARVPLFVCKLRPIPVVICVMCEMSSGQFALACDQVEEEEESLLSFLKRTPPALVLKEEETR